MISTYLFSPLILSKVLEKPYLHFVHHIRLSSQYLTPKLIHGTVDEICEWLRI